MIYIKTQQELIYVVIKLFTVVMFFSKGHVFEYILTMTPKQPVRRLKALVMWKPQMHTLHADEILCSNSLYLISRLFILLLILYMIKASVCLLSHSWLICFLFHISRMNLFFTDTFTLGIREPKIHGNKSFLWPCFVLLRLRMLAFTCFMAASCVYVYHIYCIKNYKICLELML